MDLDLMLNPDYKFKALYLSNYDGDTVSFRIDLGFSLYHDIEVRVRGVDTYEMRGGTAKTKALAKKAKVLTHWHLSRAKNLVITTYPASRKDKRKFKRTFTRYVADVEFLYATKTQIHERNLAHLIKRAGLATGKFEKE